MTTRDGRRAGVVVLLQLGHDQQRRDLRLHRHVAGDEDHRAVFAHARARTPSRSRSAAPAQTRAGSPGGRFASALRPGAAASSTSRSRSSSTGCTVRTTNGRPMKISAIDNAQRRVGHLDAQRRQQPPDPAVVRSRGGQRDAGHRRGQRERQIDERVEQAPAGEIVARQHPGDDEAEDAR